MNSTEVQAEIDKLEALIVEVTKPLRVLVAERRAELKQTLEEEWTTEALALDRDIRNLLLCIRDKEPPDHYRGYCRLKEMGLVYTTERFCPVGGGYSEIYLTEKGKVMQHALNMRS